MESHFRNSSLTSRCTMKLCRRASRSCRSGTIEPLKSLVIARLSWKGTWRRELRSTTSGHHITRGSRRGTGWLTSIQRLSGCSWTTKSKTNDVCGSFVTSKQSQASLKKAKKNGNHQDHRTTTSPLLYGLRTRAICSSQRLKMSERCGFRVLSTWLFKLLKFKNCLLATKKWWIWKLS